MSLHLQLERVDPTQPDRAAAAVGRPLFRRLAAGRRLIFAMVSLNEDSTGPGLCVSPWTRVGLERAAHDAGFETESAMLGARPALRHTGALHSRSAELGPRLSLDLAATATPRLVPRSWAGAHLCLVVPGLSVTGGRGLDAHTGPVRLAFGALDHACQRQTRKPDPAAGARIAASLFASTTLVVDASWWGPLLSTDPTPPAVTQVGYCVAAGASSPDPNWADDAPAIIDAWLASQLGFGRAPRPRVVITGSAAESPWPKVSVPRATKNTGGLAGRKVAALWRPSARAGGPRTSRALAAPVSGDLARAWEQWNERQRLAAP